MGLRVWSGGEIFGKKIKILLGAHKAPPPIITKVNNIHFWGGDQATLGGVILPRVPGDAPVLPALRLQPGPRLRILEQHQHQVLPPQQIRPRRAALLLLLGLRDSSVHVFQELAKNR